MTQAFCTKVNFESNQVRCPRCGRDLANQPAFYHVIGYGGNTGTNQFNTIPPDTASLGGPVINNTGSGYKYCFMGSSASDLGNPNQWQLFAADPAGSVPAALGTVNSPFATAVQGNSLNLPCCAKTTQHHHSSDARNSNGDANIPGTNTQPVLQNLNVYPNPATMTLNFRYTLQANITIKITDVTGRIMDKQVLQNSITTSFNLANYAPGIYLYQVITDGSTHSGKAVVE